MRNHIDLLLQVLITVTDDGGLSNTATVRIGINRNLNAPVMPSATLSATILETQAVGSLVGVPVTATDADISVSVT